MTAKEIMRSSGQRLSGSRAGARTLATLASTCGFGTIKLKLGLRSFPDTDLTQLRCSPPLGPDRLCG